MAIIRGTDKSNKLKGKVTDDLIYGFLGNDEIDGGIGDDLLYGNDGNDRLMGALGNDYLNGSLGADRLDGGTGEDNLSGGFGNDNLIGGLGDDYLDGGDGRDNLAGGDGDDNLHGGLGDFTDTLRGDDGDDYLYGNYGDDRLFGGDGRDTLYGDRGNDRLEGGDGNDSLYAGTGRDALKGGDGNDYLIATNLNDPTNPLEERAVLDGGDGNDRISASDNDLAIGGKGFDTLVGIFSAPDDATAPIVVNLAGITGKKAVDIGVAGIKAGQFERANVTIASLSAGSTVLGTKGDDNLTAYGSGSITINGGKGDDTLMAASGGTVLIGGAGSDIFVLDNGFGGDKVLDFGAKDFLRVSRWFQVDEEGVPLFDPLNFLVVGTDPKATSTKAQLLYDTDDGRLYIDRDGTGDEWSPRHLGTLENKFAIKASNILFDI